MLKIFQRILDIPKLLDMQSVQRFQLLYIEGTVPKLADGGTLTVVKSVSSEGAFVMDRITGSYTSLRMYGETTCDDSTCPLKAKVVESATGIELFDDFVPLNLFLTPGRVRSASAYLAPDGSAIADPSEALRVPLRAEYVFDANSEIKVTLKNDSDVANDFAMAFFGVRSRSSRSVAGVRTMKQQLSR